ncbi:MAG: bile acid:sodium symporter [Planctomycetota bacterium]
MLRRLKNWWFLIALAVLLATGLWRSEDLAGPAAQAPRTAMIAVIMFLSALPIDFSAFGRARGAWPAVGLAVLLNAAAAPLLGWLVSLAAPAQIASGLVTGLVVATASPSTLASGVVWTRRGGGNDGVAMLVTLVTNLGCFAVMPFWLAMILGSGSGVSDQVSDVAPPNLLPKLLVCVVAPIVLAQLARRPPAVAAWAARHKPSLGLVAQIGVLGMSLLGAINAGQAVRSAGVSVGWVDGLAVIAATGAVHVALLLGGWRLALSGGMGRPEAVAVAIAGSQKTLAVGVGIALEFGGLAIFPMIAYHVQQLLIDTLFADRMRRASPDAAAPAGADAAPTST